MCMRKRIATTSMVIVLLVCCVGVSNIKADDNNEYGTYAYFDCVNACISASYKRNKVSGCEFALATMNAILVKINANLPF